MINPITATIGIPPKACHSNARCHWAAKAKAVKRYRYECGLSYFAEIIGTNFQGPWEKAEVQATFYFKQNRRRDADNLLSSLKNAFDALQDAKIIANDYGLTYLPVEVRVDAKKPRVEITIRKIP